jgi:TolA-binding protein
MKHLLVLAVVVVALAVLTGCGSPDGRMADLAEQVTHEQSEQNQRMVEGSKAVAEGSQQLVAHDAKARREIVQLQQDLRQDQTEVARQRDQLEEERKTIAGQRIQESKTGALFVGLAIILACLAPLVLAGMSLLGLWKSPTHDEEREVLVEELTSWLGQEVPPGSALVSQTSRSLGLPEESPSSQP